MSTTKISVPPEFDEATKSDRIEFVQELWDIIASDPASIPLPEHHKRILDERLDEMERDRESGELWSEVREQLLANLRRS